MTPKFFDRMSNPAAVLEVRPVREGNRAPFAVFIKYHDSRVWQQYSREYVRRGNAVNRARYIEIEHFAYIFPEKSVFAEV